MLQSGSWPTGISWNSLPPGRTVTDAQRLAAAANVAAQATTECDAFCNQPLRSGFATEFFSGPGDSAARVTIQAPGTCRILLQRFAVMQVTQVKVSPNAVFPRQWIPLPADTAFPEYPPITPYNSNAPGAGGQGGQSVIIAPGYISWAMGRSGYRIQVTYLHGWPHTALTAAVSAGATALTVDDCTGWSLTSDGNDGAGSENDGAGVLYDSGSQEAVSVTAASVPAGPGTLTLAAPLQFAHSPGVMCSALPQDIIWAAALFASSAALTRGATATTVEVSPGRASPGGDGAGLRKRAMALLSPYRRTI
jgi:hypothetical protein